MSGREPGRRSRAGVAAFLLTAAAACGGDSATSPSGSNLPADHTERHGGVAHGVGASQATTRCVSCHGATLQGGAKGEPSCHSCHGKKWQ